MVHLAIDGMWQVFKLQRSTPRNDFCRIAAKNGILLRLINTLYSLNEATRLASISAGGGFPLDSSFQRSRSGPLDSNHPAFVSSEAQVSGAEQPDNTKARHGMIDLPFTGGSQESQHGSALRSQRSDGSQADSHPNSSHVAVESSAVSRLPGPALSKDAARAEVDLRQQRVSGAGNKISSDRPRKSMEGTSNGFPTSTSNQEQVRPLLSLLEKEPPSRHYSGQLEYARHLSGIERHESILPLLHASNEKKTNSELDFLMAEFAGL